MLTRFPVSRGARALRAFSAGAPASAKQSVTDVLGDVRGRRVLVRADLNVPLDGQSISDDTRVRACLPTVQLLRDAGARVVLCSHFGRPKGKVVEGMRLAPVAERLSQLLGADVRMAPDSVGPAVEAQAAALADGDVMLLENVRFHAEEEANDPAFAAQLGRLADVFVNDAFGTAHRAHASTAGVTAHMERSVAGLLMAKELQFLMGAVEAPRRPLAAVVGGAKLSTKLPVLNELKHKCDVLVLGGGMMFTFLKAQGHAVGASMVQDDQMDAVHALLDDKTGAKLVLPTDVVVADRFAEDAEARVVSVDAIEDGWMGLDVGPESLANVQRELGQCNTIVWNGPMGVFEWAKFAAGTLGVAQTMADRTAAGAITIVGGGDSVAAVNQMGLADSMTHISTGGGASLELLEGKKLPGVEALDSA